MTKIIASPTELFVVARSRKPAVVIVLPHAYEAVRHLGNFGIPYRFIKAAPSIAGKLAIVSLGDGTVTEEDLKTFASLSPACGMKDGRIVNTTGHVLPFIDDEINEPAPSEPIDTDFDGYTLQRADNEWYYYVNDGSPEQNAALTYIHGLAMLAADIKRCFHK